MKHLKKIETGQKQKHATQFSETQIATAPYNFVSMPENIFVWDLKEEGALDEALPSHDRYHEGRFTGWIDIKITCETETYIRAGLEAEPDDDNPESEYQKHKRKENRAKPDFFTLTKDGSPVIPGSSLRGLMRSLVEITTSGKMTQVNDLSLFFRTFANDTIGPGYRDRMIDARAGYVRFNDGQWQILPCEFDKVPDRPNVNYVRGWVNDNGFSNEQAFGGVEAVLMTTGPMQGKRHAYAFHLAHGEPIDIAPQVIERFHDDDQLTKFQRKTFTSTRPVAASRDENGHLAKSLVPDYLPGEPVFYIQDQDGQVEFLGRARNFRLPFKRSPLDLVPKVMKNPKYIDVAESLFGFVRTTDEAKALERALGCDLPQGDRRRAYRGRLRFLPAFAEAGVQQSSSIVVPPILSGPSAKAHRMYLAQPNIHRDHQRSYDSNGAQLRGHKLYWHQPSLRAAVTPRDDDTQHTQMKPVPANSRFRARVHFENLTLVELSVLLWVMHPSDTARHKIGMGRPHGYGSIGIDIESVNLSGTPWISAKPAGLMEICDGPGKVPDYQRLLATFNKLPFFNSPAVTELMLLLEGQPTTEQVATMGLQRPGFRDVGRVLPGPKRVLEQ